MTKHVQVEAGGAVQVSLKSKSFLLFVPDADKPIEGDRAGSQADSHPGVIEPVSGEAETGLEKSQAQPTGVQHLALAGTGGLDPVQGHGTFPAVITGKIEKPHREQGNRTERVDEHQTSHRDLTADITTWESSTATGSSDFAGAVFDPTWNPTWNPTWGQRKPSRLRFDDYNLSVEFALRDFRPQEFEALWRIDQQCFAPGISYSRLELATYLQRPGAFALVVDALEVSASSVRTGISNQDQSSAAIVGFIVAEAASRGTGHIVTIDVLPNARGVGVGSRLLQVAEERLRAAHCDAVILETAVDNRAALSFYKRHNYTVIKTLARYYSNGVDALALKKDLLSPPPPAKLPQ